MSDLKIQSSFNSGEWAPALNARVDLAKYKSGAALLENFFVDYRGGASTRAGTKYILQCFKSDKIVRLVPFQASFDVGYVLEFGDQYIRFFIDGAPVLEPAFSLDGVSQSNPMVFDVPGNDFAAGDWVLVGNVASMTQISLRYFQVLSVAGDDVTIGDLNGNPINSTAYTPFTGPANIYRIYTISSPYADTDLALVKFTQNVKDLILCHPSYPPYVLTLVQSDNWTLAPIVFGTTAAAPTITALNSTLNGGTASYTYVVTSVDSNGQESEPSVPSSLVGLEDIRTTAGSNRIIWDPVPGAVAFNVYAANPSYFGVAPDGTIFGFIGTTTGYQFIDSNIAADFSQTPPVVKNPFLSANGSGVASVTVTNPGTYTTVPDVAFTGAASSIAASAAAILGVQGTPTVGSGGTGYAVGDRVVFTNNVVLVVATEAGGVVTAWEPITATGANVGQVSTGPTPTNPVLQVSTSGSGINVTANLVWGVESVSVLVRGAGYVATPAVTFSAGAAAATAVMLLASDGYPSVPSFFQQRLVLAAPNGAPQTFYMSQPGAYYNYNVSLPAQADNAITGTLVSGQLNSIKSLVSQQSGLLVLTDSNAWLINGGSNGSAVTPSATVANAQSYIGANDVPPIVANFDILFVQSKGSVIRDNAYNIYSNVFTGTDISVISSHLFYGYQILEWTWAEEPYKVVWAVRNDGVMLTLTFLKEQEFIGWTHQTTQGSWKSVASITEATPTGNVDAVYSVAERTINGFVVKYIERNAERIFPNGVEDAWTVDCALHYEGPSTANFTHGEHLAGTTVTGLADGVEITPFMMPINGNFTLPAPASKVTIGLGFICDCQTLALDLGEPTVQGKVKKISDVTVRVAETLGLDIGQDFNHLTPMKDLVRGNVSKMLTGQQAQQVTGLVTGDANTILSPAYTVPGQYCIRQSHPYPATILGVIPNYEVGDSSSKGR